jgi:hypothetical protein
MAGSWSVAPSNPAAARRPWPRGLRIAGWSALGVLGAAALVYFATVTFGAVHGTEFSPDSFDRREFSYFQIPLIRLQITGEKLKNTSGATETFLTSKNLVQVAPAPNQRWHLVRSGRGAVVRTGDAGILMKYLDAKNSDDDHRWVKWSEDHPRLAVVLWSAVQKLAQQKLYVRVPELFELAKRCDDPTQLQAEIDRGLAAWLPSAKAADATEN